MAEVQSGSANDTQLTQRFIEFVMVQAQQAAFALGKIPHPTTGETMINLEAARVFIDHLELIREKTRGNLSQDEETILNKILADLQMTFVEVAGSSDKKSESPKIETPAVEASQKEDGDDSKKKFSKTY